MSGRPEKRRHDDDAKSPSKKIKDWGETECAICRIDFEETDDLRKLDCGHKFHQKCMYSWLNSRMRQEQRTCPTCSQQVTPEEEMLYESGTVKKDILEQDEYDVPLFFGAVVCLKNANGTKRIIGKYFNVDLDLDVNSTIGNLRNAILVKHPEYKINRMYFGTPATCDENPDLFQKITPAQTNRTLIDVYEQYHKKFFKAVIEFRNARENNTYQHKPGDDHIDDLYFLHEIDVDGQNIQTDYLYNPYNPDVPEEYIVQPSKINEQYPESVVYALQPIEVRKKSTYQRIAWIVFEVERKLGGGSSTRKKRRTNRHQRTNRNQHTNQKKSRKYKK